jgi:hypothetical protein
VSDGHGFGVVITLEPKEPSRAAGRRLLDAVSRRASIRHPNLVRAWPLGWADGRLFVDFEVPSYPTLAERLAAAPLDPVECVRILDGLAAGAAALQEGGLMPRAVTPEDVVVHPSDGGILMDHGIPPELRREGLSEQGDGHPAGCVYSLGAILFAALTGARPNGRARDTRSAGKRSTPNERRADLAPEVERVVARAMAADPAERYADVRELSQAAGTALEVKPACTPPRWNGNSRARQPSPGRRVARAPQAIRLSPVPGKAPPAPRRSKRRPSARPVGQHARSPTAEAHTTPRASSGGPAALTHVRLALVAASRRCAQLVVALLAVAVATGERLRDHAYRFARAVGPAAHTIRSVMARVARRSAEAIRATLVGAGPFRMFAGREPTRRSRFLRSGTPMRWRTFAQIRGRLERLEGAHRLASVKRGAVRCLRYCGPALFAGGAIAVSVLAGTALGGSVDVKDGPSSVTRSGVTVELPPGWEESTSDREWSAIVAEPSEESKAALMVGELRSLEAAERILEELQRGGTGRTPVRLGSRYAWRYADLRSRPRLVGAGYALPTADGAVLFMCVASRNEARVRLDECNRAATTLVVQGEPPRSLSALSRSKERLTEVIATLRSSRSEARRRLAAADRPRGQVRAATALKLRYLRAARSLDGLPPLENGRPIDGVSAALRAAGAAYGSLADASKSGDRPAYREASHELVLKEEGVRRELARASGA